MQKVNVVETFLDFQDRLVHRECTDMIVVHHTGECGYDNDWSAEKIHRMHIEERGWAGIGYHYVIRKDGTIERGRQHWTRGAHAQGDNWHTIGIHVSGNFEKEDFAETNNPQMESLAMLIANIAYDYGLQIDSNTVVGHCDLMSTDCPGANLYDKLNVIIGKANWYLQN